MQTPSDASFSTTLNQAGHVHRFVITPAGAEGWDVSEERDSEIVRTARYSDWHRVERARSVFTFRVNRLRTDGPDA